MSLAATKEVLKLPFAASPTGAEGLLLLPRWKPKAGTDYADDLKVIQEALDRGDYTPAEAEAARAKALADDFETQAPQPRLCYQLPTTSTRSVKLADAQGATQTVSLRQSYFADQAQSEDLDWQRSLLPRYYTHLAAALARPLVLRPYVYLSAAELVAFDQLQLVWLEDEQALFWVNKLDGWEDSQPSTAVELIRLE